MTVQRVLCNHEWHSAWEDADGFATAEPMEGPHTPGLTWVTRCLLCGRTRR